MHNILIVIVITFVIIFDTLFYVNNWFYTSTQFTCYKL